MFADTFLRELFRAAENPERTQDEQGGWRARVYGSGLTVFLSQLLPFPDPLCPGRLRHQFFEVTRALVLFLLWNTVIRNVFHMPGVYAA